MTEKNSKKLQLVFYGDDFTGSTDSLEFISRAGARAVLFLDVPTEDQLRRFPDLDVAGVAGITRSLSPEKMEVVLLAAFEKIKQLRVKQVHYKVCSTFDSSPLTGSIGKAMDCAKNVFYTSKISVVCGSPSLGRYCVFGNLFARMGIGSKGAIYRLDRHPSMREHPVTPSNESDLRIHLSQQTDQKMGVIDILQMKQSVASWQNFVSKEETIVLLDALYHSDLEKIGDWLANEVTGEPVFSVGGSGVEEALGAYWNKTGLLQMNEPGRDFNAVETLLVVSGSCSPVTAEQIEFALNSGFEEVIIDADSFRDQGLSHDVFERVVSSLKNGKSTIVHTGKRATRNLSSEELGAAFGKIVKYAAAHVDLKRVVVAGGDTSSYAARAMEVEAVEMYAPVIAGAPLCKIISLNRKMDGLEVNFKGGQVGNYDYFQLLRIGRNQKKGKNKL